MLAGDLLPGAAPEEYRGSLNCSPVASAHGSEALQQALRVEHERVEAGDVVVPAVVERVRELRALRHGASGGVPLVRGKGIPLVAAKAAAALTQPATFVCPMART
jgi:hypothetical protein